MSRSYLLNHKIICGKSETELTQLKDNSIDSCVCDPPYNLSIMGETWDSTGIAFNVELWKNVYRVLKPGAHLLAFGGTRTYHRMACAIEDAGFEVRDMIEWIHAEGCPKSLDISKSIDKSSPRVGMFKEFAEHFRNQREKKGLTHKDISKHFPSKTGGLTGCVWNWENAMYVPTSEQWKILQPLLGLSGKYSLLIERIEAKREITGKDGRKANYSMFGMGVTPEWDITTPNSEQAIKWDGWGTSLKPAHESILLARKPISEKNIADNVLKWGVGGININGCRTNYLSKKDKIEGQSASQSDVAPSYMVSKGGGNRNHIQGRFPTNLILECCCEEDELVEGELQKPKNANRFKKTDGGAFMASPLTKTLAPDYDGNTPSVIHTNPNCVCKMLDSQSGAKGGASRYFYQAKASQKERWFYCTFCKQSDQNKNMDKHIHNAPNETRYKHLEFHPTQKPVQLIQYLIKLITPPNGTILDPFLGSGTSLIAAEREQVNCIGIDSNQIYCSIANQRLKEELMQTNLFEGKSIVAYQSNEKC